MLFALMRVEAAMLATFLRLKLLVVRRRLCLGIQRCLFASCMAGLLKLGEHRLAVRLRLKRLRFADPDSRL